MLLAIDVGNTNIVYGLFDGERLVHQFRVESARGRNGRRVRRELRALLDMHQIEPKNIHAAIIACVVPSLTDAMMRLVRTAFGHEAIVVGPGSAPAWPSSSRTRAKSAPTGSQTPWRASRRPKAAS